ncbi:hypothetical protein INR49_018274 [Caranx melampygus]|nr:hypothetical protein INR49_018274 [Caranx melampygus]
MVLFASVHQLCTVSKPTLRSAPLSPWISTFSHPGVRDYSQLTLDLTRNELIVGARNYLFRLDLSNMSLIQVGTLMLLCLSLSDELLFFWKVSPS